MSRRLPIVAASREGSFRAMALFLASPTKNGEGWVYGTSRTRVRHLTKKGGHRLYLHTRGRL
jgi:hypothetical protein